MKYDDVGFLVERICNVFYMNFLCSKILILIVMFFIIIIFLNGVEDLREEF